MSPIKNYHVKVLNIASRCPGAVLMDSHTIKLVDMMYYKIHLID